MYNSLVSIIIPVYNRKDLVVSAIECSINQTYKNIEIIIGDNCSTDGTWDIIEEYSKKDKRIILFRNESNIGPVKNWINCIKHSKGEFIKILFSDDTMDLNWIEEAIKPLNADKNIGFSFSPAKIYLKNKPMVERYNLFKYDKIFSSYYYILRNYFRPNLPYSPCATLLRNVDVLNHLHVNIDNPLNINYYTHGGGVDLLLLLEIAEKYKKIAFIKNIKVHFVGDYDSISLNYNLNLAYDYIKVYFINKYYILRYVYKIKLKKENNKMYKYI